MDSNLFRRIADKQEAGEEMAIVTVIASNAMTAGRPGAVMAIDQYGQIMGGSIGDDLLTEKVRKEAEKCLNKGHSRKMTIDSEHDGMELYINVFSHRDRLIVVGSGSLVLDIYQMALIIGYDITIIDSRAETLTRDRFPLARELLLGDIVELLQGCEIDGNTSIVIASHNHEWDQVALKAVIRSSARYIGILGNKRKVTAYFAKLNMMDVSEECMDKVHIPIGLDIGGQKTAEIALAVVAEMQAVKYGRSGGFLTVKNAVKGIEKRDELF